MVMSTDSELRIPANPEYIVVAKRAAAGFACVAGFDVEAIDDLTIAVSQACENAITLTQQMGALDQAQIRLTFSLEGGRLDVQVRSLVSRQALERATRAQQALQIVKQVAEIEQANEDARVAMDLALRMMGLFVDDCRYRVDERTGGLRVRLTKYRAS